MPKFNSRRRVNHSAAQMFDLVADVERYPEFVPLCRSLKIRQRTPKPDGTEIVICEMTVSFKLVRETFTTRVTLDRPNLKILVEYLRGPFSNLENRWTFEPKPDDGCDVGFLRALADFQRFAQRHEFGVALDVGHQIEHLRRAVGYPALAREFWHRLDALAR